MKNCSKNPIGLKKSKAHGTAGKKPFERRKLASEAMRIASEERAWLNYGLFVAIDRDRLQDVVGLLDKGADVDFKTTGDWTMLMRAIANDCQVGIPEALIERGADVNARDNIGRTALMLAAHGGLKEIVELLIAKGADVNAKAHIGWTVLMHATGKGTVLMFKDGHNYPEIAELLRKHGAKE